MTMTINFTPANEEEKWTPHALLEALAFAQQVAQTGLTDNVCITTSPTAEVSIMRVYLPGTQQVFTVAIREVPL